MSPEQSGQVALSDHMISHSPFDQTDADDGSHIHPDITALTATKTINLTKVSINRSLKFKDKPTDYGINA